MTDQEHAKRLALYNQRLCDREIGEIVGVGETAIYKWRKNNGLKANTAAYITDNRRELYDQGCTDQEIARGIGKSVQTVKEWRHFYKLKNNRPADARKSTKASLCWSCTRARALPDPYGCAFHRKEHKPIYSAAEMVVKNSDHPMLTTTVTECKFWELSIRDMRDRAGTVGCKAVIGE